MCLVLCQVLQQGGIDGQRLSSTDLTDTIDTIKIVACELTDSQSRPKMVFFFSFLRMSHVTYPAAMTSLDTRSVTKLFAMAFKTGSNTSGGTKGCVA